MCRHLCGHARIFVCMCVHLCTYMYATTSLSLCIGIFLLRVWVHALHAARVKPFDGLADVHMHVIPNMYTYIYLHICACMCVHKHIFIYTPLCMYMPV